MRRDIDLSFIPHPLTGDLPTKTGSAAIKQSLKNIVMTSFTERGFNVEVGSGVKASLFSNFDALTIQTLKDAIKQSIRNFEPQAEVSDVRVNEYNNDIRIDIFYYEVNNLEQKIVSINI